MPVSVKRPFLGPVGERLTDLNSRIWGAIYCHGELRTEGNKRSSEPREGDRLDP